MSNYYTLVGTPKDGGEFEIIFGDYDKAVVEAEQESHEEDYTDFEIVVSNDAQEAIGWALRALNFQKTMLED